MGKARAEKIASFSDWDNVQREIEWLEKSGVKIVRYCDSDYPELLKQIFDPPFLLYIKGRLSEEDKFSIGIVGSRKATPYGMSVTDKVSGELAASGFTIVSGMARGVDSAAHRAAVKKQGRTIAVLGCGINVVYPPENRGLLEKITEAGAVVTEFSPGTKPARENFPVRNRLISGLSLGVLVIEATEKSGSLITANHALDQNREVFAIPGNILSDNTTGTHKLIQRGAKLVHSVDDIISELAPALKGFINKSRKNDIILTDEENRLCSMLSAEPIHIDDIIRESGMFSKEVLMILLNLELKNIVKQLEGKKFQLLY